MKLPTRIKVGKVNYAVLQPLEMDKAAWRGSIKYSDAIIKVSKQCNVTKKAYTPKERAKTFWHEVTHGILHDMGHPLADSEQFVESFALRLNNAIHSARFD